MFAKIHLFKSSIFNVEERTRGEISGIYQTASGRREKKDRIRLIKRTRERERERNVLEEETNLACATVSKLQHAYSSLEREREREKSE
mmetsp:Transcript_15436/g.15561  ORF Transcript_15436/g.15561 Transcript_15436/m.15561 type:complete len:88 (+) Transcript_15436:108-371(+)